MVFGLQLSFARLGSTVNFNVMGPLYAYVSQFYTGYTCTGVVLMIGEKHIPPTSSKFSVSTLVYSYQSLGFLRHVPYERPNLGLPGQAGQPDFEKIEPGWGGDPLQ